MGVLEDAIREHLELKRKHGASDMELRQQEAEALGPARRAPEDEAEAAEPSADAAPVEATVEPEAAHPPVETGTVVEPTPGEPPPVEPPPVEPPPSQETKPHEPVVPPPEDSAAPNQDTIMYSPGDAPVPPEEDPDFVDEVPEDDSLGTEQKPQRDLDFE